MLKKITGPVEIVISLKNRKKKKKTNKNKKKFKKQKKQQKKKKWRRPFLTTSPPDVAWPAVRLLSATSDEKRKHVVSKGNPEVRGTATKKQKKR